MLLGPTNEPCLLVLYSEADVQRSRQTKGRAQVYLRGHESSDGPSHELTAAIVREREPLWTAPQSLQQQNTRCEGQEASVSCFGRLEKRLEVRVVEWN